LRPQSCATPRRQGGPLLNSREAVS
jgi:hypothetical protein